MHTKNNIPKNVNCLKSVCVRIRLMSLRHRLIQHTNFNGRPNWLHLELYVHKIFFSNFLLLFLYFSFTNFVFFSFDLFFFQFYSRFGSEIEHQPNSPHINFTNCVYLSLSILSTSVVWYKDHWIDLVHFMFHFYCDYCLCIFFFVFFPVLSIPPLILFFLCLFLIHSATRNHFNWSKHGKQRNETFTLDI